MAAETTAVKKRKCIIFIPSHIHLLEEFAGQVQHKRFDAAAVVCQNADLLVCLEVRDTIASRGEIVRRG